MAKKITAKLGDILDAFDFVGAGAREEHEAFLCKRTGKVHWHSAALADEEPLPKGIGEPGHYIAIPYKSDLNLGNRLAIKFTAEHLPEALERVEAMFKRPGAYGRFHELLNQSGRMDQWNSYQKKAIEQALREWCKENGIQVEG